MKIKLFYRSTLFVLISLFILSCNSDKDKPVKPPKVKKEYLVDFVKVQEKTQQEISSTAGMLGSYLGVTLPFMDKITNDVDIYTIKYKTTFEKKEVIASGLVLIPKKGEEFPILSFQNGTNAEHSKAPSVDYKSTMYELFSITSSTGFIVSIPDYLGFGASAHMYHPYLHKKSTVQSMVDMLKAVRELTNGKRVTTKSSKDVYLSGYSQGGWSTMCLQKALELDYSEEFNVKASSCGAGPYNLETVVQNVLQREQYNNPYFLAYVFNTMYKTGEIGEDMIGKIVREPYAKKMTNLFDGVKTGGQINAELSTNVKEIFTDNFIKNYSTSDDFKKVRDFLQRNSVGFWKTAVPTKLFHGTADDDVPFFTSQEAYQEMKKLGVADDVLQLVPIKDKNHYDAFMPTELVTLMWFLDIKK